VVTVGKIEAGVRGNVISDDATLVGTLRTLDPAMRKDLHERVKRTAEKIAESAGATADVTIGDPNHDPVTFNNPALTAKMLPTLQRVAGADHVVEGYIMGAEDFSYYQEQIPGLFVHIGIRTPGAKPEEFPSNHSARFHIDESGLKLGVRVLANLAVDYLQSAPGK